MYAVSINMDSPKQKDPKAHKINRASTLERWLNERKEASLELKFENTTNLRITSHFEVLKDDRKRQEKGGKKDIGP